MFGPKVIGAEAFAVQQKKQAGGSAFGPRVRDDLPGHKVASAVQPSGAATHHGKRVERAADNSLSIADFCKTLDSNPAFLETLHLQELERPDGPRRECLLKARQVAIALTNRPDIVAEIDGLVALIDKAVAEAAGAATTEVPKVPQSKAERIAEIEAIDSFARLCEIAHDLGLDKPKSKKDAKAAIIAAIEE